MTNNYRFRLGKACTLRDGKDVTLITCGDMVENTLAAAASLAKEKIEARVINMSSIKPIDEEAIAKAAQETGKIVTVDNHNILGGLGSAVCEVVAEKRKKCRSKSKESASPTSSASPAQTSRWRSILACAPRT
jgi:transketolase